MVILAIRGHAKCLVLRQIRAMRAACRLVVEVEGELRQHKAMA